MICNECETVAHCMKHGCIPKQPAQLPIGVKGCLVAIKTLLSRDPRVHANTAIQMIDALLANEALDKMAKNARELGLDYAPAQHEPVAQPASEEDMPEALRLADELIELHGYPLSIKAAAELRRLHEANQAMLEALKWMVANDDTNEGDYPVDRLGGQSWNEYNAYWIDGLNKARAAITKGEQA